MIIPANNVDARHGLAMWLAGKLDIERDVLIGNAPFEIVGVARQDGVLMGVVLYNNYRGAQIEMACAGMPGWLTRETLAELFAYPFIQLGCWTVLTGVKRANAKAREFNRKLGFRELCAIPQAPQKTGDTILYCMTRDQCRWLKGERLH